MKGFDTHEYVVYPDEGDDVVAPVMPHEYVVPVTRSIELADQPTPTPRYGLVSAPPPETAGRNVT